MHSRVALLIFKNYWYIQPRASWDEKYETKWDLICNYPIGQNICQIVGRSTIDGSDKGGSDWALERFIYRGSQIRAPTAAERRQRRDPQINEWKPNQSLLIFYSLLRDSRSSISNFFTSSSIFCREFSSSFMWSSLFCISATTRCCKSR